MTDFTKIPEALQFIAGHSWLTPDDPVVPAYQAKGTSLSARPHRLGWREAGRQIAAIIRRI